MHSLKEYSLAYFKRLGMSAPDEDVWWFDASAAEKPIRFIERLCCHSKGALAGKPFTLLSWQREWIATLYGWMSKADNTRKYRKTYLQVARKAGKTLLASGLGLYQLLCETRDGIQEVLLAASTRDQAKICLDNIKEFIRANKLLAKEATVYRNQVSQKKASGVLRAISSEGGAIHGANPSLVIVDELHVHKSKDLYEALTTAQGARGQPLFIVITTAGNDISNICYELYTYATAVRDGVVKDEHFLPAIYELPKGADWNDESLWHLANPSIGHSNNLEFLQSEYRVAKAQPSYENSFKQLYLNFWVTSKSSWLDVSKWNACSRHVEWERIEKLPCWLGIDLSSSSDTTAITAIYKDEAAGVSYIQPHVFVPQRSLEKLEQRSVLPFRNWLENGFIKQTSGEVIDVEEIQQYLTSFIGKHNVRLITYDPFGTNALIPALQKTHPRLTMLQLYQGFKQLSPKCMAFEKAVIENKLLHDGHPVLTWQISNCGTISDAEGNIKVAKKTSSGKIDAAIAGIMAYGSMVEGLGTPNASAYNDNSKKLFFI